jgi:triphosphatase
MSTEIELKLRLSPKTAAQLANHPLIAGIKPQRQHLLNTYYDTPALDLQQRRIALRFRKKGWQWLLTVKSAEPASGGLAVRNEWETAATPGHFDFSHVDNPELRAFLDAAIPKLEPVFTTDFHRLLWQIPFGGSRIEIAVDRGSVESRGRKQPICELELELLDGDTADIFGLTRKLQENFWLQPAIESKAERGYALFHNTPKKPFRATKIAVSPEQTPVNAFKTIALGCLEQFQRNEAGLLDKDDPEFIHQARVALRRLRSAIKLFAPVLPADFVAAYGQAWQTLGGALGDARNWDVFSAETLPPIAAAFPSNRAVQRLKREGARRAKLARKRIADVISMAEYPQLLLAFTAAVHSLEDTQDISLAAFARDRLTARARQARRLASRHAELTAEERHRMRICFKKLRYVLEFFNPLLPKARLKPYLAALAQLQDQLGLVNDQVTAELLIHEVVNAGEVGPVHGWVAGRHALLIQALPEALATWLAQRSPW